MKKILIALISCVSIAISAKAAAVSWSITAITATPDSAAAAGWIGYILDSSKYDEFSNLTTDKVVDYVSQNAIYSGKTADARGKIGLSIKDGSYEKSTTVASFLVLFDNSNAGQATYYANTAVGSVTISELGADGAIKFGTFTDAMNKTGSSSGWVAIPEPTSGLLMLLGMAGLALKRKHV